MGPVRHGEPRASVAGASSYHLSAHLDLVRGVFMLKNLGLQSDFQLIRGTESLTCMKAVAIITPDPKYLVMKNAKGGTRIRLVRAAKIGSRTPVVDSGQ